MSEEKRGPNPGNPGEGIKFLGKTPPAFFEALQQVKNQKKEDGEIAELANQKDPFAELGEGEPKQSPKQPKVQQKAKPVQAEARPQPSKVRAVGSPQLEQILLQLREQAYTYTPITLPSKGVFYNGEDGPQNGILHLRPMTGEDEQILTTPKFSKRGYGVNLIFKRCCKETIQPDNLLSVDRTYLLIALRSLSYGHEYEVEIKCPECSRAFNTVIRLDQLMVKYCDDNFQSPLMEILPKSGLRLEWHLPRGKDELLVTDYRDRRVKEYGDNAIDDSLLYRTALMIDDIEGLQDKTELLVLLKKLPVGDVAFLRALVNDPPFGVETKSSMTCSYCYHDFEVELPLEAGFFFPRRRRKTETVEETNSNSGDI